MSGSILDDSSQAASCALSFKLAIVEKIEKGEMSVSQAKRAYKIENEGLIRKWIGLYGKETLVDS